MKVENNSSPRRRHLPPFSAIRAFEAAARHLSFKSAADELCLSPSAVSHQIRALEDYLATSLFHRDGNRVALSKTGMAYAGKLTDLLDNLSTSTEQASAGRQDRLRVLATPGFAARWLIPRLSRFAFAQAVRLRIAERAPSIDFTANDADVVIQWRTAPASGIDVVPFLKSSRSPVAAPEFVKRESIAHPSDLLRVPLFKDETDDMWQAWFLSAGIADPSETDGPTYPNCEYATTAAEAGLGVALAYDAIVHDTVADGRLVMPFETSIASFTIYSAACSAKRQEEPLIKAFRDWLVQEAMDVGCCPNGQPEENQNLRPAKFKAVKF